MAFRLAELFVEFSVQGMSQYVDALDQVRRRNQQLAEIVNKFGQAGVDAMKKIKAETEQNAKKFDDAKRSVIGWGLAAEAAVLGFVRAGLAGTAQGNYLAIQFERLSREVAGIFLPAVEKLIEYLEKTVNWFRGLSGAQQDAIMKWTLWGTAALAAAVLLPILKAGFMALIVVVKGLSVALYGLAMNPVLLILTALTVGFITFREEVEQAIRAMKEFAKEKLNIDVEGTANLVSDIGKGLRQRFNIPEPGKKGGEGHRTAMLAGGGFEGIEQTYRRIQESVSKADYGKQTVDNLEKIGGGIGLLLEAIRALKPGMS